MQLLNLFKILMDKYSGESGECEQGSCLFTSKTPQGAFWGYTWLYSKMWSSVSG